MKTSKALVFDIKRFAVHDGYGLRTTVFFKGCPLRCQWCQNPEGLLPHKQVIYFEKQCIHCQRCLQNSIDGQMEYKNNRPYFHYDYQGDFDNLIKMCPSNAIRYDSEEYDIETLLEKIKEDQVFFRDDGGVTFSGGEPLLQGEFLLEILKRCKEEGIHTAIETTLYASYDFIKTILPYLDLIYIDLKVFDEQVHKEMTGVSSHIIKKNIESILKSQHKNKVIIRTPLIPSMTATKENIQSISQFLATLDSQVRYELLNYNPLASSKYELLNLTYSLKDIKPLSSKEMQSFYDIVDQEGIHHLIRE